MKIEFRIEDVDGDEFMIKIQSLSDNEIEVFTDYLNDTNDKIEYIRFDINSLKCDLKDIDKFKNGDNDFNFLCNSVRPNYFGEGNYFIRSLFKTGYALNLTEDDFNKFINELKQFLEDIELSESVK